jgi:hypothetical protein
MCSLELAACVLFRRIHATPFLHNEVGTFTDEWPQEWSYAIARASPTSRMEERERERERERKRERERIGLVVPPVVWMHFRMIRC